MFVSVAKCHIFVSDPQKVVCSVVLAKFISMRDILDKCRDKA